ncbi:MAG TPA: bifunctional oligoribonuclease/PAP phosphatase NrnA [Flavobacteriaceae bacterium]|nr:bifunctional oligoribonuclease/PAP phosphatase NrnA [Flavobacteriaceae bacterium]
MTQKEIQEIKGILSEPKKISIIHHKNADGDAIGSSMALNSYLNICGHKSNVISPNKFPEFLKWLDNKNQIIIFNNSSQATKLINDSDMIFTLDFNSLDRCGDMKDLISKSKAIKILIDHHENPKKYANYTYSDTKISSTCEMIYNFIGKLGDNDKINSSIAEAIYTGIMTDTGSFRFSSTSSLTHKVISDLLEKGANKSKIHNEIYDNNRIEKIKLLSFALSKIEIMPDYNTAFISLSQKELNKFDFRKGDTEGIVNYGLSIRKIKFAAIFIEDIKENITKISFRSKGNFDVNKFSRDIFNGGGHKNASGAISRDSLSSTIINFKNALKKYKSDLN